MSTLIQIAHRPQQGYTAEFKTPFVAARVARPVVVYECQDVTSCLIMAPLFTLTLAATWISCTTTDN